MKITSWKNGRIGLLLVGLALASLLVATAVVAATSGGGGYDLSWNHQPGGGKMYSTGAGYSLGGSVAGPAVAQPMTGSTYSLTGGFWVASDPGPVYLPVIRR
jgi:hypothetical protein